MQEKLRWRNSWEDGLVGEHRRFGGKSCRS